MSPNFSRFIPICLSAIPVLIAQPLCAAETLIDFNIGAQSLADALLEFSQTSGLKIFYSAEMTKNLKTSGLNGKYTAQQGLQKLLNNTGLQYRFTGNETVTIENAPLAPHINQADPTTLPKVTVNADSIYDADWESNPRNPDYNRTHSTAATKTDSAFFETPVSVQVVPNKVMQDQKSYRVQDALENVSGIQPRGTFGGYRERYIIRGFRGGENFYRNGLRVASSGYTSAFETADIDRIDVLKGGASMLYGRGEPSGAIAFTTKRPGGDGYHYLEQNFGSYDYYRTTWDTGSPLTKDGKLSYRFSGAYTNTGSFRDFVGSDGFVIYPTLLWKPTENTDINLGLEVANQDFSADLGIPAVGTRPAMIPISRSFQDPNQPKNNQHTTNLDFNITHRFNQDWTINNRFLASYRHHNGIFLTPVGLQADNQTMDRNLGFENFDQTSYATNFDIIGNLNTWNIKHKVLVPGISNTKYWSALII
jgi:iron complex outermembrane receptor protein